MNRRLYCVDTDVFIGWKDGPYPMGTSEWFWRWVEQKIRDGVIYGTRLVYEEILRGNDELADWIRNLREYFPEPSKGVQTEYGRMAQNIVQSGQYPLRQINEFLKGADLWNVAQAKVDGATVVTGEKRAKPQSTKIKVPNVCEMYGIPCIGPDAMLNNLTLTKAG